MTTKQKVRNAQFTPAGCNRVPLGVRLSGVRRSEALMFTRSSKTRRVMPLAAAAVLAALATAACGTVNGAAGGAASATGRPTTPAATSPSAPVVVPPNRQPGPPRGRPSPVVPVKTACTGWPSVPAGTLPASFVPASVLRCVTGYTKVPGKGTWLTATLEKADTNLTPLATALRALSGTKQPGQMCPQFVMIPPAIVLVGTDGTKIRPHFPVTDCGQIQQQVFAALGALHWQTVSQRLVDKAPAPVNP
jgi:hypothetical protein